MNNTSASGAANADTMAGAAANGHRPCDNVLAEGPGRNARGFLWVALNLTRFCKNVGGARKNLTSLDTPSALHASHQPAAWPVLPGQATQRKTPPKRGFL